MLNFIICDDIPKYRNLIKRTIDKFMMKNKLEYRTHEYDDYDQEFLKIVSKRIPFKIYILDIEAPTMSGIDVARIIRRKDVDSVLIFLTGHNELVENVSKKNILFLTFINKFDRCEERLTDAIEKSLQVFKVKKVIRFKDSGIHYAIPLEDILYITRDSIDRKSIIVTDYNEIRIGKHLNEIEQMLTDDFIKTHRACFINKKRVVSYNKAKRIALFDNGTNCDLISTRFNKELI